MCAHFLITCRQEMFWEMGRYTKMDQTEAEKREGMLKMSTIYYQTVHESCSTILNSTFLMIRPFDHSLRKILITAFGILCGSMLMCNLC